MRALKWAVLALGVLWLSGCQLFAGGTLNLRNSNLRVSRCSRIFNPSTRVWRQVSTLTKDETHSVFDQMVRHRCHGRVMLAVALRGAAYMTHKKRLKFSIYRRHFCRFTAFAHANIPQRLRKNTNPNWKYLNRLMNFAQSKVVQGRRFHCPSVIALPRQGTRQHYHRQRKIQRRTNKYRGWR